MLLYRCKKDVQNDMIKNVEDKIPDINILDTEDLLMLKSG